ncbi:MAG: hypothetical protein WA751_11045 [Candidatus Dormiibacterota bacterium]
MKRSRAAADLLVAAAASFAELEDIQVHQLALTAREAMDRLHERLQLLEDAHRIADRHRASDLLISQIPAVGLADPLGLGAGAALAQGAVKGL